MSNKEIDLQSLLSLDEQIQRELGAMESNISQLPQDGISRNLYSDYMARFNRIRALFDRTSDVLRGAPLEQTNPDLYDILLTKERISASYNVFNRLLGGFTRQYNQERSLDEGRGERAFAPSAAPAAEDEPTPEEEPVEEPQDGPSDEELEAALAEEEAAEEKAAEKKKKAAKRAREEKAAQAERDAIERDRMQREAELRDREDRQHMEDRRLEEDRLAQDRARDAMLSSELYKTPYDDPSYPEQSYPGTHAYEPTVYERAAREYERLPEDRPVERPADYERRYDRAPEYDKLPVNEPPRYAEQERFYPSHQDDSRHEQRYPEQYPSTPHYEDRRYEAPHYEAPAYTAPAVPEYEDRRQAPQSAADKRDQELRDANQRAIDEQRREEIRRERDARFERYRDRQQSGFTREEQQFGHFDYSAREGETGRREHGHSAYKSYDFRDDPTYTAHEYAPGGTTQRSMTIGSVPEHDNKQRFYSAPAPGSKTVTPEYLEQHRYEMQSARLAYEQVKGTPEAAAAGTHYEQIRRAYEDTCKRIHSGDLEVSHPAPVHRVDFQARPQEPPRPYDTPRFSTQYGYLPNGGITGSGISDAAPNGSVSYYNTHRETPPAPAPRYEPDRPYQGAPTHRDFSDVHRTSPFSSEPRHYPNEPVKTQAPQHTPDNRYQHQPSGAGIQPEQQTYRYKPASHENTNNRPQDGPYTSYNNPAVERFKSMPSGQAAPYRDLHLPHSYRPLQPAAPVPRGSDSKPSHAAPADQSRGGIPARNVLRNDPMPSPVPNGPRHFHVNTARVDPEVSRVSQIPGYFRSQQESAPSGSTRKAYIIRSFEGKPVSGSTHTVPASGAPRQHTNEPVRPAPQQRTPDSRSQHQPSGARAQQEQQAYRFKPASRGNADTGRQSSAQAPRGNPAVEPVKTTATRQTPSDRNRHLPHSYRPMSGTASASGYPRRVDPVMQINKFMAARNVLRNDAMPSPVPAGPRHFHINAAKSNPDVSKISQIPGYFRSQPQFSPLGGRKPYIINSFAGRNGGPAPTGSSGQSKDGSSNGNGPRKKKVEETSADLLNRKSKIRTESVARYYGRVISGKMQGYASWAFMAASRRFYQIAQSGEDNGLRTLEQGRYYGAVTMSLASAYIHRKPVSSVHAIRTSARREFREYGRFSTMSKKLLTHDIHESLKANRQLKNEIRELMAKGSSLTVAERAELLKKRAQLMANSLEPRKMHGFRNMQAAHARNIRVNEQIEAASKGGRITVKTVQQAMQADFKAREAAMAKKFGHLNRITDKSLRLEIQQQTHLGRVLKREIKDLKALQAAGKLTPAQMKKLQELLKKHEANNKYLRQLHGLKKARLESTLSQKNYQGKLVRLSKNQAAIRGGLYALYGILTKPIREGSETGAQGLLKFANIATNHYVHEFIKRSLSAVKKTYLWSANITHFNRTRFYKGAAKAADKVSSVTRAIKGAPKKAAKKAGKAVKKGVIHTYDKVAPVKVKTSVSTAYNRYIRSKNSIVQAAAGAKKWASNTWVGRAYSSVNNFFGNIGRAINTAFNAAKAVIAKLALVVLLFMLLIQIISMFAGGGGGLAGSIILSPYEGPDDKLDLGPYNTILDEEWDEYMDDLQQIGIEGGYYKVVVDMDVNPDNVKEILSMMAVRLDQDLDILGNLQVKPYIEDLLRASHPYWTEKDTVTCDDIGTCSNKVYCSEDGKSCYSSSKLCSHGSPTRHRDYYWSTEKDPKTGKEKDVKVWYTYYTWDCAGHCGGHPRITFHVRTLGFDEIFEVDPHGYPTSSSASASTGALRGHYTITYYCNEKYPHTCNAGPPYKTATGTEPTPGRTIAVDPHDIALGAHVVIDGHEYVAEDTGGAVDGKHIDILVDTHEEALQLGTRYNVPVYKVKYSGESMEDSGEWSGWTDDNREWAKAIYEQDWTELYCGIPNVTDEVGRETDLSGVVFVNGSRPGHQSIVNIARSQEGQVGGRPFWSWYGFDNRVEWCACFVSWCANRDGVLDTKIPKFALCSDGVDWFVQRGQWAKRGDTTPVAGDIIFFSWNANTRINHVGIVIGSDANYVYTIEGNSRDKCRVKSYPLNSPVIYGYGLPNY